MTTAAELLTTDSAKTVIEMVSVAAAIVHLECMRRAIRGYRRVRAWRATILELLPASAPDERAPTFWLHTPSAVALLVQWSLVTFAVAENRTDTVAAIEASIDVERVIRGLGITANVGSLGLTYGALSSAIAALALAITVCSRLQHIGLAHARSIAHEQRAQASAWASVPGPSCASMLLVSASYLWLGCVPMLAYIGKYAFALVHALRVPDVERDERVSAVLTRLDDARTALDEQMLQVAATMFLALLLGIALLVIVPFVQRYRISRSVAGAPAIRFIWLASGACVLASIALVALAQPYADENANPVMTFRQPLLMRTSLSTVLAEGPDVLEISPLLQLSATTASLDGRSEDPQSTEVDLAVLKNNWTNLNAGQPFPGGVVLVCDNGTLVRRLLPFLVSVHRAGYTRVAIVVGGTWQEDRPVLGRIRYTRYTSALATLASTPIPVDASAAQVDLPMNSQMTCEWLARFALKHRSSGRAVELQF